MTDKLRLIDAEIASCRSTMMELGGGRGGVLLRSTQETGQAVVKASKPVFVVDSERHIVRISSHYPEDYLDSIVALFHLFCCDIDIFCNVSCEYMFFLPLFQGSPPEGLPFLRL